MKIFQAIILILTAWHLYYFPTHSIFSGQSIALWLAFLLCGLPMVTAVAGTLKKQPILLILSGSWLFALCVTCSATPILLLVFSAACIIQGIFTMPGFGDINKKKTIKSVSH